MEHDDKGKTRYLHDPAQAQPMQDRVTGPLDQVMPWVIEFRVVGTHHIIKVPVKETMLIGRADPKNNVIPDIDLSPYAAQALGVSRQHAVVTVKDNRITIRDRESPNGTYINDQVLTAGQEYRLRDGDKVRFGRLHLQIHFVVKPTNSDNTQDISSMGDLQIPKIASGQLVMVVDDDAEVSNLVAMVLQMAGFEVMIRNNVADAITAISQKQPDALITELLLPDRSGLDLVNYIRHRGDDLNLPIMVVSAATAGFQMGQAMNEGVDIFLGKPFAVEELVSALRKIVEQMG